MRVLDVLRAGGVPATFFIQGRWAEAFPRLARRIAEEGHQVGSHSHYHARMPLFTRAGLRTDVRAAEWAIRRTTGVDPRPWFRLPFGSGATQAAVVGALAALGYRHVGWDVEVKEWRARETSRGVGARVVDGALAHGDGAVVLLHTWPDPVGRALEAIVVRLSDAGAQLTRVDELPLPPGLEPIREPRA